MIDHLKNNCVVLPIYQTAAATEGKGNHLESETIFHNSQQELFDIKVHEVYRLKTA